MQAGYRAEVRLLVVDVDQTLFDWLRAWALTYRALLDGVTQLTGVTAHTAIHELGALHRAAGSSEPPDPLLHLSALRSWHREAPGRRQALTEVWERAVAYGDASLTTYAGVSEALRAVRGAGTAVVACSETDPAIVMRRLRRLDLLDDIDALAVPRPSTPEPSIPFIVTGADKPDVRVLHRICEALHVLPRHATCVGDHLHKDVGMAQAAGLHDVWARYGTTRDPGDLALLDRLRHWDHAGIDAARFGPPPAPTSTLEASMLELLELFRFVPAR